MRSFTTLRNTYGVDTKNTSTANLNQGDEWMNDYHRRLLSKADWPFLHRLRTATTVASTTFVELPYDVDQVESAFVTSGSTRYTPIPAPSRKFWDELHYTTQTSDTPEYWFVYNGQFGLWPRPSTVGNTISISAKIKSIELANADLASQTISVTSGSAAVTGSSTTWRRGIVGHWMRVAINTSSDTTSGDGTWYEISAVSGTTAMTLVKTYNGGTVTSGVATIGQMPLLPEAFHDLPEHYAAFRYWSKEKDTERATAFQSLLTDGQSDLFTAYGVGDLSMVLDDGEDRGAIINPNLVITL